MLRNVLTTVWAWFWNWGLVEIWNLNFNHKMEAEVWSRFSKIFLVKTLRRRFGHIFEAEVLSRFWSWILVKILRLKLDQKIWSWILFKSFRLKFGQDFEADIWLSFWAYVWSRLQSWISINLRYDLKAITLVRALNPWAVVPLAIYPQCKWNGFPYCHKGEMGAAFRYLEQL